jgi:hypothetical protein
MAKTQSGVASRLRSETLFLGDDFDFERRRHVAEQLGSDVERLSTTPKWVRG